MLSLLVYIERVLLGALPAFGLLERESGLRHRPPLPSSAKRDSALQTSCQKSQVLREVVSSRCIFYIVKRGLTWGFL